MIIAPASTAPWTLGSVAASSGINTENYTNAGVHDYKGLCQADITGTNVVRLEGRMTPSMNWVSIATLVNGLQEVFLMPEMRANMTAWTSGSANIAIGFIRAS